MQRRMKQIVWRLAGCLLVSCSVFGIETVNAGVNGNNSRQGLMRMDHDVLFYQPDVCFIAFGMNDAVNDKNFVPVDEYRGNLKTLVLQCRTANILPVLVTVNPVNEERLYSRHDVEFYKAQGGANCMIDTYNQAIKELAEEDGVDVIDWHARVLALSGTSVAAGSVLSSDGVHLSPEGLNELASLVVQWIEANGKEYALVVAFGDSITKQGWIDRVNVHFNGAAEAPFSYSASAPSAPGHEDTVPPSMLCDGEYSNVKTQSVQFNQHLRLNVDLGAEKQVRGVTLHAFQRVGDFVVGDYELMSSLDGQAWTSQAKVQNARADENVDAVALTADVAFRARYLMLKIHKAPGIVRILLGELEIDTAE